MTPNKTILRASASTWEEAIAAAAIKCGYVCEKTTETAGGVDMVQPHSNASNNAQMLIAEEDALQGRSRATDYAIGERVFLRILKSGDKFLAKLKASENVAMNDALVSAGDGSLQKASSADTTSTDIAVLAYAKEASNVATLADLIVEVA